MNSACRDEPGLLRFDTLDFRVAQPLGRVDLAHQRGYARARLSDAANLDARPVCFMPVR